MNWSRLKRTVAPEAPPVSLSEARLWLRLDGDAEDLLIDQLLTDATDYIEGPDGIGLAMAEQTWTYSLDAFPSEIRIPLGPVLAVSSITYVDTDGAQQTLDPAEYQVDTSGRTARIRPAYGRSWPSTRGDMNAVVVTFTAGFDQVPGDLKRALFLLVGHWYVNREAVVTGPSAAEIPLAVEAILNKYRVGRIA